MRVTILNAIDRSRSPSRRRLQSAGYHRVLLFGVRTCSADRRLQSRSFRNVLVKVKITAILTDARVRAILSAWHERN